MPIKTFAEAGIRGADVDAGATGFDVQLYGWTERRESGNPKWMIYNFAVTFGSRRMAHRMAEKLLRDAQFDPDDFEVSQME